MLWLIPSSFVVDPKKTQFPFLATSLSNSKPDIGVRANDSPIKNEVDDNTIQGSDQPKEDVSSLILNLRNSIPNEQDEGLKAEQLYIFSDLQNACDKRKSNNDMVYSSGAEQRIEVVNIFLSSVPTFNGIKDSED